MVAAAAFGGQLAKESFVSLLSPKPLRKHINLILPLMPLCNFPDLLFCNTKTPQI